MAETHAPIDVFKFVALRPAQRADEHKTAISFIRDARTDTEDGRRTLSDTIRERSGDDPAGRQAHDVLAPWSDAWDAALVAPMPEPFEAGAFLASVRAEAVDEGDEAWECAWLAVYLAYRTGGAAGSALELPIAALRWLHACRLAAGKQLTDANALKDALTATPLVPPLAMLLPDAHPPAPIAPPTVAPERNHDQRLLDDIAATENLLAAARQPQVVATTVESTSHQEPGATAQRADAVIRRMPQLHAGQAATEHESRVLRAVGLTDKTPVPEALRSLETHLQSLVRQAYARRDDLHFVQLVRTSDAQAIKKVLSGGPTFDPSIWLGLLAIGSAADVDMRGRIKPLGIGDLKVVKQTLLRYVPGEVAHIENVLQGESKARKHRVLDRSETTLFTSEEETNDTERDTQTTDRFELKREVDKTISEDMKVSTGLTVTGGFGPVQITAQGNFAYSTSQQESQKNSANFAREVVDRTVSKIQKKTKTERTTKTLHEVEEINDHGINNVPGYGNVTGVYRWVDKRYRAQVYNYGVRLMIEFIVPEPAAFFRLSLDLAQENAVNIKPPIPFLDLNGDTLTPADIDPTNYQIFTARYNASGVAPPPTEYIYIGAAFEQNELQNGHTFSKSIKDIAIPDGYVWDHYEAMTSIIYQEFPQFTLQIGGEQHAILTNSHASKMNVSSFGTFWGGDWRDDPRGVVAVSAAGYDINAYVVHIGITCRRTADVYEKWQLETYEKIATAYQALQTAYEQKVAQARANVGAIPIEGRNPDLNREIEKRELKRLCVTLLTGQHFNDPGAVVYPTEPGHLPEVDVLRALDRGKQIQFFEQAFDWEQITYLFYPYFWTRKDRWIGMSNLNDPDPLFAQFLEAGAARVVIPVPMAYKEAVLYYLETGLVWEGGESPRLNDLLFKSIAQELKNRTDDLAGATPEGEPWEFTLPTTLVWLQPGPDLPVLNS